MQQILVNCRGRNNINATVSLPNICPHCGEKMTPQIINDGFSENAYADSFIKFGLLVRCSVADCKKYFALEYERKSSDQKSILNTYFYKPPLNVDLPENIEKVSSSFVEIYKQARRAEEEGLHQISGVGYRKSLEFLIKDYVIYLKPETEEQVKRSFLGNVIKEHLSNFPKLQSLARAATWIGNDETHYVRRHDNKDIRDMKQFIKSASHFIVADYDADLAESFISSDD